MSHPPSAEGIVLVDFDGTIFPWGSLHNPPAPLRWARAGMLALKEQDYIIGIFTSRLSASWHRAEGRDPEQGIAEQRAIVAKALNDHDIPFDFITAEKVPAVLYLDDKAMRVSTARDLHLAVLDFLERGDDAL